MRDFTVSAGPVQLAVRDYGGDGRPVVLLHGLSSNVCIWDHAAPLLTPEFRVVAYDQRGHGLSDNATDYGFDATVRDLTEVVAQLGLEHPVVVGHSWGASVALGFAARTAACPGVVCVDGGLFDMRARGSWEETARRLRPPDMDGPYEELAARMEGFPSPIPWDRREPVFRRSFPVGEDGIARRKLPIDEHMLIVRAMYDERGDGVYPSCPVLMVLAGGVDEAMAEFTRRKREAADRLGSARPNVRVEWLPSVHDMPLLHPAELADFIAGFARVLS